MEVGLVRKIDIDKEMQQAYLDYAMSVIVARALPDARDGLKPVHRRILYAMHDMGLRQNSGHKKSARVVGEVLGKYHPHSDTAVYDAMVRMAQEFSMRYPLVDGQGNFGSVDGDPAAAMRYTEARMTAASQDMMADIQKGTVEFSNNFDDSLLEPKILPSVIPNMLINGATGIAVGMATNIPPHNLNEVLDAINHILENWKNIDGISVDDLMNFIKGPDFPTGGVILQGEDDDGIAAAYGTGRGRIIVQARAHIEEMGRGRKRIIVTELPYMTNKSSLIGRIATLAREGTIEGISDLRDESDRQGMRIVIELSKSADGEKVLSSLYKRTPMRSTFGIIMLALVEGEPRLLGLKQAIKVFIEHRLHIIQLRSEYDLARAQERAHILEGLRIALKNLDEVIELIRKSADVQKAQAKLITRFKLSEIQADAILNMPLRRLAALERKKIDTEYRDLQKTIKRLEILLASKKKMRLVVSEEMRELKEKFGDRRRTLIVKVKKGEKSGSLLTTTDFAPNKPIWVAITKDGLISRTVENKAPRPSGRGAPYWLLRADMRDTLYLVARSGRTAAIAIHSLPEAEKTIEGVPINKVCGFSEGDQLSTIFSAPSNKDSHKDWFVFTITKLGMVKKSPISDLPGPSSELFQLINIKDEDQVGWVQLGSGQSTVLLTTKNGKSIRFAEDDVRAMGLAAAGVNGIKLKVGDELIGANIVGEEHDLLFLASDGNAKRVPIKQFASGWQYFLHFLFTGNHPSRHLP